MSQQDQQLINDAASPSAELAVNEATTAAESTAPTVEATRARLRDRIRLSTVDNFQGEEAAVVAVSTVRCNSANRCGLKEDNRVNVMLSRAKHGMIVFGSGNTVRKTGKRKARMFNSSVDLMEQRNSMSGHLDLCCKRHHTR